MSLKPLPEVEADIDQDKAPKELEFYADNNYVYGPPTTRNYWKTIFHMCLNRELLGQANLKLAERQAAGQPTQDEFWNLRSAYRLKRRER